MASPVPLKSHSWCYRQDVKMIWYAFNKSSIRPVDLRWKTTTSLLVFQGGRADLPVLLEVILAYNSRYLPCQLVPRCSLHGSEVAFAFRYFLLILFLFCPLVNFVQEMLSSRSSLISPEPRVVVSRYNH
jgi:hypothetical protein